MSAREPTSVAAWRHGTCKQTARNRGASDVALERVATYLTPQIATTLDRAAARLAAKTQRERPSRNVLLFLVLGSLDARTMAELAERNL